MDDIKRSGCGYFRGKSFVDPKDGESSESPEVEGCAPG